MGDLTQQPLDEITSSLNVLEGWDVQPHHWARLRTDKLFAERIAGAFANGGRDWFDAYNKRPLPYDHNLTFFDGHDWEHFFQVTLTPAQWEVANNFPWPDIEFVRDRDRSEPIGLVKPSGKWVGGRYFAFLGIDRFYKFDERHPEYWENGWQPQGELTLASLPGLVSGSYPGRHNGWQRPGCDWYSRSIGGNPRGWLQYEHELARSSPKLRWYLLLLYPEHDHHVDVGGRFPDWDRRRRLYERPTAVEYNLGLLLYFQKYGGWPYSGWRRQPGEYYLRLVADHAASDKVVGVTAGCQIEREGGHPCECLVVNPIVRGSGDLRKLPIARMRKLPE